MKSRQEIKEYAKQAFAAQRNICILGLFLVLLLTTGLSYILNIPNYVLSISTMLGEPDMALFTALTILSTVSGWIAIPLMLLTFVLSVNLGGFFVKAIYGKPVKASEPYSALKVNFGRKLGGMCWVGLWLFLWALIGLVPAMFFIMFYAAILFTNTYYIGAALWAGLVMLLAMIPAYIPLIIKSLEYSMAPYILANNPKVTATEALNLSKRMTKGHKGKLFVLILSFIGWHILSFLTLGLLYIFYVGPYENITWAGFFVELRNLAVTNGEIHPSELEGKRRQNEWQPTHPYAPPPQYTQPDEPPPPYPYAPPGAPPPPYPYTQPGSPMPPYPYMPPGAPLPPYPYTPPGAPLPPYPYTPPGAPPPQYPMPPNDEDI